VKFAEIKKMTNNVKALNDILLTLNGKSISIKWGLLSQ